MTESTRKSNKSTGGGGDVEDEDEEALFIDAMEGVKPLKGRKKKAPPPAAKSAAKKLQQNKLSEAGPLPEPRLRAKPKEQNAGEGLDRNTDEKLRRGRMPIEARLDLHGLTQGEAKTALEKFVLRGHEGGKRCVLVITGKGKDGTGILKNAVPEWLRGAKLRDLVLQFHPAKPQHGGAGALYVLLRRKR